MALPDLTGQNIENTYQRILQTDGVNVYDGTGSLFVLPSAFTGTDQQVLFVSGSTATGSNDLLFDYNNTTLNINGDLYVSGSGGNIIDSANGLLNTNGIFSVDWSNRQLWDSTPLLSINWKARQLYNSFGIPVLDYETGNLSDQSGILSNDWFSRYLYDAAGTTVVDYNSLVLYDGSGINSANWNRRSLTDPNGNVSLEWDDRTTLDSTGVTSIDWENRKLVGGNGVENLDWRSYVLRDSFTSSSLNWSNRRLFGPNGQITLDWANNNVARVTGSLMLTGSLVATQSFISKVQYIDYELLTTAPAFSEGRLHWSDDTKTIEIDTDVNGFEIEVGHVNVVRVVNKTGGPLAAGKVVYISGSQGNRPTVVTASWDSDMTSATTLGFVAQTINDNNNGYVVTNGLLRSVNTNAYPQGTQLYLSSSGDWTSTVPVSPKHEVRLGKVIRQSIVGIIYVDVMNGYELGELHDVLITSASNGQALVYSSSLWVNGTPVSASHAVTSSFVPTIKSGAVSSASFGGSPFTSSVTFGTAYGDTQYAVTLTGEDDRIYVVNNKQTTGFVINTNSSTLFTGSVYWIAIPYNS